MERKTRYRIGKANRNILKKFFWSWVAVCCLLALFRILIHYTTRNDLDTRKYITKCGCLQMAFENLGFHKLIERLDGQQHYEIFDPPRPLNTIVPDFCMDAVDDLDLKSSADTKKMDIRCFRQTMSMEARKAFAAEAYGLIKHLQSIGVWVAMSQGTALGSKRSHGFLPWDDDLDFMVLWDDKDKIVKKLSEIGKQKGYQFGDEGIGRYRVKCFHKKYCGGMTIDLWYTTLRETYLEHYSTYIPIEDILPLTTRPFEGYWFPAPANTDNFLIVSYGSDYFGKCVFHNHMWKSMGPEEEDCPHIPCSKLKWRKEFPHVEFCHLQSNWTIELYINERYVHSVFIHPT